MARGNFTFSLEREREKGGRLRRGARKETWPVEDAPAKCKSITYVQGLCNINASVYRREGFAQQPAGGDSLNPHTQCELMARRTAERTERESA